MFDTTPCPDSGPDDERDCWRGHRSDPSDGVDVVSWLKAEMLDGLDHECAHAVLGPALFGVSADGVPNFEVYRDGRNGSWMVRGKPDWKPEALIGIVGKE